MFILRGRERGHARMNTSGEGQREGQGQREGESPAGSAPEVQSLMWA